MNKILLVDVDSKIPNIALMKLSTYYKKQDYIVDIVKCNLSYSPSRSNELKKINAIGYDKVLVSVIFTNTLKKLQIHFNDNIEIGGTGYSLDKKLPDNIQQSICDYSLYPENDTAYGFISRGCIRNCSFCFVPKKEGKLYQENNIDDIIQPQFKQVKFLDNNFLALLNHKEILKELVDRKIKYQFNQGIDIRLLDDENAELLCDSNYLGDYIFAFDNISYESIINKKLELFKKYFNRKCGYGIKFFIYCHPDMNITDDVMYRINWCKNNKVLPYLMRHIDCWQSKNKKLYIQLARWCNQPNIFKKMTFEEFNKK